MDLLQECLCNCFSMLFLWAVGCFVVIFVSVSPWVGMGWYGVGGGLGSDRGFALYFLGGEGFAVVVSLWVWAMYSAWYT